MRRLIAVVLSFFLLCPLSRAQIIRSGGTPPGTTWQVLKIGAGGFITGIDITRDGTKFARTDTYGAWIFNTTTSLWQQVVTTYSMPSADAGIQLGAGVYEVAIAPSNTQRLYMMFNGRVYRSDDRGATWIRTAFTRVAANPNDGLTRTFGRYLAVDPANADVVYAGTPSSGLFVTANGGTSWSPVASVGTAASAGTQGGGHLIAFDPSSSVSGGKTQGIYVSTYGTGVYHSTNGGATWALTNGTPTTHRHIFCDQNGVLYLTDNSGGKDNFNKWNGSAWSQFAIGNRGHSIAVDPADANRIFIGIDSGDLIISTNGGSTWVGPTFNLATRTANDIPWLAWTNETYMSNGDMRFDPSESNKLYFAEGIGVWYTSPPNRVTAVPWNSQSAGLEQLVTNWIISPPGGQPVVSAWDRPVFYIGNPDIYPSAHGVNRANAIISGWSVDWASSSPSTIVCVCNFGVDTSGYSNDGGRTWTAFGSVPSGVPRPNLSGSIAASTSTNFVWIPSNHSPHPYYTTDAGKSWNAITISGVPTTGETGWGFASYFDRQIVAADRVNANTFYAYNYGPAGSPSAGGIYKSTDSGATWSHAYRTAFPSSGYNAQMRSVPGQLGNLFFTSGSQSAPHPANTSFYRSRDAGATWTTVANVREVWSFGFGKAAPGKSYPTIFIYGWVNNVLGIWRSDNNALTWVQISDGFPLGRFDAVTVVEGDNNTYGKVYIGFHGSGFVYGTLNFLLNRDLRNDNDNSPVYVKAVG